MSLETIALIIALIANLIKIGEFVHKHLKETRFYPLVTHYSYQLWIAIKRLLGYPLLTKLDILIHIKKITPYPFVNLIYY